MKRQGYAGSGHLGAGDGNRTRVASLEGWSSTIELHPPGSAWHPVLRPPSGEPGLGGRGRIRTYVGRSQRVYSPSPLATRAPFRSTESAPRRRRATMSIYRVLST